MFTETPVATATRARDADASRALGMFFFSFVLYSTSYIKQIMRNDERKLRLEPQGFFSCINYFSHYNNYNNTLRLTMSSPAAQLGGSLRRFSSQAFLPSFFFFLLIIYD
jgi:hypothetical protein